MLSSYKTTVKSIFLFLLIYAFLNPNMDAQTALLPSVGITSSSIEDFDGVDFDSKIGYTIGLDLRTAGRFYIQPGLHYELVRNNINTQNIDSETDFSVSRIRIPVMFGLRLFDQETDRKLNFRAFTGPVANVVMDSKTDGEFDLPNEDLNNFLFGWNGGVGVDFLIFFADLGYTWGLSEVFDDIEDIEEEDSANNVFYMNAGLRIRF
ncbi:MAG TPA: porin family protein [Saprospiraceae bacterium]|nr:porin family protein [Saprospiraceae bacterium]